MGVTISTHNGSAVSREHNIRNPKVVSKEPHIDMNGKHEIWIDEPIKQAYDRLFGQALREYNAKQNRAERKIKSYYQAVCKNAKKHPVYEMIIGIYGKNETGCSEDVGKEIMQKFVAEWKERNPNLELIGAYYHADEPGAEPHLHLDYVPVAHGYSKGLATQTGLVKALGEQGFIKNGKATAQIQWEKRENDYLTALCEERGISVSHPRNEGIQHLETKQYKIATEKAEQKIAQAKIIEENIEPLKAEYNSKKAYIKACDDACDVSTMYPDYAKVTKSIFGKKTVTVPADMWEKRHISANEKDFLKKATEEFENEIACSRSNQRLTEVESQLTEVVNRYLRLNKKYKTIEEENKNLNDEINEFKKWERFLEKHISPEELEWLRMKQAEEEKAQKQDINEILKKSGSGRNQPKFRGR